MLADGLTWNGVWVKDGQDTMDFTTVREALHQWINHFKLLNGYRPIELTTWVNAEGLEVCNVLFWRDPRRFDYVAGRTLEQLLDALSDMRDQGFVPIDINAYVLPDGQGERYNAVFEENDYPLAVRRGYGGYDLENEVVRLQARGFEPWIVNAFVLPEPASTASLSSQVVIQEAPPATLEPEAPGIAVDANRVYATRYLREKASPHDSDVDGVLVVADRNTLEIIHSGITVGHQPRHVAVNPVTGRIYVVNWGKRSFSLSAIDGDTFETLATIELHQGPLQVAINPTTNRVYVTNWFQGRVHVIDGDSHQPLPSIELGKGPVGIDVDPTRNQIYVAVTNRSFPPFRTGVSRVTDHADATGYGIEPFVDITPLGSQSQDVAVDPAHDRVYVANLGGGGVQPSVSVLHRSDLDLLATVKLTGPARAIAVNGAASEVYVATDRGVAIVDGATNTLARVIEAHPSWNIAAAPGGARQIFVAERSGDITRFA